MTAAFDRGRADCIQDRCENVPFASVGGPGNRESLMTPGYIHANDKGEYIRGYEEAARALYGEDWRTCSFEWKPVLTIKPNDGGG